MVSTIEKKIISWARFRGWDMDDAAFPRALSTVSEIMEMKKTILSKLSFESQPSDYTNLMNSSENDIKDNNHKND